MTGVFAFYTAIAAIGSVLVLISSETDLFSKFKISS